jgi:hypothetical protein
LYDALLNLRSPFNVVAAGTTNGPAMKLGRNRAFRAIGRVSGVVTGSSPTMTISLEESTTGTSAWTAIPGSMTVTEQVGKVGANIRPEIPSSVTTLPSLVFQTTKDYVRTSEVAGGTTPGFPGLSVVVEPVDLTTLASGR